MNMLSVYFISGLGADERFFKRLKLPVNWKLNYLPWPELSKKENIESYAHKIASLIDSSEPFILIGLSFGGMMAVEINKILKPKHTIIISSITTRKELPILYRGIGISRINRIVPMFLLNKIYPLTYWFFGVKAKNDKQLLKNVIHDTSPIFLRWALNEVINWKNKYRMENLSHIHGTEDKLFPFSYTNPDFVIHKGGHMMVYNRADEISKIIIELIESNTINTNF